MKLTSSNLFRLYFIKKYNWEGGGGGGGGGANGKIFERSDWLLTNTE